MGKRVTYEIITAGSAKASAVLQSDGPHPTQDAETVFKEDAASARLGEGGPGPVPEGSRGGDLTGPTGLLERLLSTVYASAGGGHASGDRMFRLAEHAQGCERVVTAHFDASGGCTVTSADLRKPSSRPRPRPRRAAPIG